MALLRMCDGATTYIFVDFDEVDIDPQFTVSIEAL